MIEHPNMLLVHHCLQAASDGDHQTLRLLWAPDIVWHIKGQSPWRGEVKGADQILEYLAEIGRIGAGGLRADIDDILISNDRAAMICHAHAVIGDQVLDADYVIIANIMGRRIHKITSVPVDPENATEFWQSTREMNGITSNPPAVSARL
jgi:ketosteroid isomerase-like protein